MESKQNKILTVITVNYNRKDVTKRCLDSLLACYFPQFIVLVDNHSKDSSIDLFSHYNPRVHLICNQFNEGFCRGNNIGIDYAMDHLETDYICLLNNDTIVTSETFSSLMEKALALSDSCFMLTPKIYYNSNRNKIWYAGAYLSKVHGIGKHIGRNNLDNDPLYSRSRRITYASGCCMFFPAEVVRRVGKLNERMFMYLDDTEFCLRLQRHRIPIYYTPQAIVYHDVGSGESLRHYHVMYLYLSTRNRLWVTSNLIYRAYLSLYTIILSLFKIVLLMSFKDLPDKRTKIFAILKGLSDGLLNKTTDIASVQAWSRGSNY